MLRSKLSLLGIYNWDNTVLDGLVLPDNFWSGALEQLRNNLLIETAELEILYTEPEFLKFAISTWCQKRLSTWKWLRETQLYDYNPIWNADYKIHDDTLETRNLHGTLDTNDIRTDNLTAAKTGDDTNKHSGNDTVLHSVYGFNEQNNASPKDTAQNTYNSQEKLTYDNTLKNTGTQTQKNDHDTSDTGTVDTDYDRLLQGNYGTTTTQDMIKQEQELAQFNLLDYIIDDFKKRFCILVF